MPTQTMRVPAEFWPMDSEDGQLAFIDVENDENRPGCVAIHTFVNGEGSKASYYFDRESALIFARDILNAVALEK